ncbi:MAG: phosphodiester glycosidase family protein [Candidatus Riflebacteria bacterium]|nr:phosphodiester glycosidase family protein [Candidatus Riflebacteria bacterium]
MKYYFVLLLLGQMFLVGAYHKQSSLHETSLKSSEPVDAPVFTQEEPEHSVDSTFSDKNELVNPTMQESIISTQTAVNNSYETVPTEIEYLKEQENSQVILQKCQTFEHSAGQKLQMVFSSAPDLEIVNYTTSMLRIKLYPRLASISADCSKILNENLKKYRVYTSSKYSEVILYPKQYISKAFIATNSENLPIVEILLRDRQYAFPLENPDYIEDGLMYFQDRPKSGSGLSDAFIVKFDPKAAGLSLYPVLANEGICQREVLSSISRRHSALAAINATYFVPPKGDPIGTLIINKRLISSPLYNRSVFGMTQDNLPVFGNPDFSGNFIIDSVKVGIDGINQPRQEDKLIIYTPEYGKWTLTSGDGVELILAQERVIAINRENSLIPPDGIVVSASGEKADSLRKARLGDVIRLDYSVSQPWNRIMHAICGGPRLLLDGNISITGRQEKFDSSICSGRHPRTAVAQTSDGDILLIVVDGRSSRSKGMTLNELAAYIADLGGRQAMNLDGGGSSSMFIRGKIVNRPSDGKERPISNALIITKK